MKEILPGAKIVDISLFLKKEGVLILGDIHIGFDEAMQKQGVLLPKFHFKDLMKKLKLILEKTRPKTIIINGDIKHEFGTVSDEEWRNTLKFIDYLMGKAELILIKGNHDTILEPISRKREIDIRDYYIVGKTYICHGHRKPKDKEYEKTGRVIISHDHPAITLRDGPRVEKYKCFLVGKNSGKEIIILPAFSPTAGGSDIMKEKIMNPMVGSIKDFKVYVVEKEVYDFGKVKDIENKLKH